MCRISLSHRNYHLKNERKNNTLKIRYHFGRSYRKRTVNICFAIILSYILAVNPVKESIPVQAAVTDNIGTAAIDQKLGTWDDTSETHSIIGLLRLIIEKLTTHLEKMDVLNAKMNALDTKIDLQTASLETGLTILYRRQTHPIICMSTSPKQRRWPITAASR